MTDTVEATSPSTRKSGLDGMLVGELKQLGASLGLKGTGAMRKGDLVLVEQGDLVPGDGEVPVSPSKVESFEQCGLRWVLEREKDVTFHEVAP